MALPSRPFLCLRHGTTDWNRQGRFQGLTDNALNEAGLAQARVAGQRLAGVAVAAIVASPLRRAVQTAEAVAAALGKEVSIDAGIIECDFGSLEGQSIRETMRWRRSSAAASSSPNTGRRSALCGTAMAGSWSSSISSGRCIRCRRAP
ncbi:histidine phosphatase family protein [Bradyrhizobium altum]|uniref:histidine phosphatase family protein n=1 Tax=Bradyrhizobium altum TaxID=1571202 RepID=UPI002899F38E|nr:histidine phosphatase family protein [Bradyrhizobium altum]